MKMLKAILGCILSLMLIMSVSAYLLKLLGLSAGIRIVINAIISFLIIAATIKMISKN